MFPARYFPDHYFTGHYFPHVGLTPPGIIRILVNGQEVTDGMYYGSAFGWNVVRSERGTCTFPFVCEPDALFAPQVGEPIEAWDPADTRVFKGIVENVGIHWLGDDGWRVITVTGIDLVQFYDTADIEKVKFTGVSCGAAFTTLFNLADAPGVSLGTVEDGPTVESLEVSNVADGFRQLALIAAKVWYFDPADSSVYFHAPGARDAAWEVNSEDILWETMDWKQDRADVRNKVVLQQPSVAMEPVIATYDGDDVTTAFTLPSIPQYIISIAMSIGSFARATSWEPGTDQVTITPPLPTGSTVTIRYSDEGLISVDTDPMLPSRTLRYTKTRTFTPAGGLQVANAILARYSMLPALLTFSTDRAGIQIGRRLTIDVDFPEGAGSLLNGKWLVKEIRANIVPGMDRREDPVSPLAPEIPAGHFRYTVDLINTAATAIFQGDGETTEFVLPVTPTEIQNVRINAEGHEAEWTPATRFMSIVPALGLGESAAVDYIDGDNAPDVPSFINTWDDSGAGGGTGQETPIVLSSDPPGTVPGEEISQQAFAIDLTLEDLAVRDDCAPHTLVHNDGTGYRLLAVLRKDMDSDLTVRFNKGRQFALEELITVTIPGSTVVDEVFEWPLSQGSPAVLVPFFDKEIITADILESDESTDTDGIIQFTIEWTKNPIEKSDE